MLHARLFGFGGNDHLQMKINAIEERVKSVMDALLASSSSSSDSRSSSSSPSSSDSREGA